MLEPGTKRYFRIREGEVLHYDPRHGLVVDFLGAAYRQMESQASKRAFQRALGKLFAEYLAESPDISWHITEENPAISLLYLVSEIRAYGQLPEFILAFNNAKLEAEETDQLMRVILTILLSASWRASTRRALIQLVSGPKFQATYAIETLQIELHLRPFDFYEVIQRYARMIHKVCVETEQQGSENDKRILEDALAGLQALVNRAYTSEVRSVFNRYHTKFGQWRVLVERIVATLPGD